MLIGKTLDEALALQGVQPVKDRLIRDNLTPDLDLADQGRAAMLEEILSEELQNYLLFFRQGVVERQFPSPG